MTGVEWVDVFTDRPGAGNPAAVCVLDAPAPAPAMQAIAAELGLSETAFAWPLDGGGFSLRWFTPVAEVDLCGHATIATAHVLRRSGRADGEVSFETRSGVLGAAFDGDRIALDLPAEEPEPCAVPPGLAPLAAREAATGRFDLLLELHSVVAVADAAPDLRAVAALERRGVILTAPGPGGGVDYVLRFFAPRVGVPEDPATGSAQCLLGPWWAGRLGRAHLVARQLSRRGGDFEVTVGEGRVGVAGGAVTVLTGRIEGGLAEALGGPVGA